jgi:hypothetical protein
LTLKPASKRSTRAGAGAVFLTLFTLVWNAMVWGILVPDLGAPFWFKAVFVACGVLVGLGAAAAWRNRIRGSEVSLRLEEDPVQHGVPTTAYFTLRKPLALHVWTLDVTLDTAKGPQSGFGRVWEGSFPATTVPSVIAGEIVVQEVKVEFTLPADLPSTQERGFRAGLVLKGDGLSWRFDIQTRPGTASELTFHSDARAWAPAPVESPREALESGQVHAGRSGSGGWVRRVVQLLFWGAVVWFGWGLAQPYLRHLRELPVVGRDVSQQWSQTVASLEQSAPPPMAVNGTVDAAAFPITIGNWLMDDWRYRAQLQAQARLEQGALRVQIERLQLMPVSPCKGASDCRITAVGLLLSHETAGGFRTLAKSALLPWAVNLGEVGRAELDAGEWRLALPVTLPEGDVRLKLVVQAERIDPETGQRGPSWVYPSHGNHLVLQMALARAGGASNDPCQGMASVSAAVRAGCDGRLVELLQGEAAADQKTLDAALIDAVLHANQAAVPRLLQAGASPDAKDSRQPSHTALVWGAAGNQMAAVEALVAAGADVHHRDVSRNEQIITPLTLALKRDAAEAVAHLLKAGARLDNNDLNGWTVMHIAAFEGVTKSMAVLVEAGGDVNQRAQGYRQQTAFHTALQYAPQATIEAMLAGGADAAITDDRGENACGWAKFFQRPAAIQALVCGA